ncbi:unnamed protein product [Fusarium venenatum]|uniref:NAD-dependent epimerase/dehydratase domain-containing protein n=1 Tax=Fusarium venenatum TaxID=56646 RepID=A0A2L2TIB0_9HYPO|nr:uncharacterized protein FVRRES_04396 [Fusarium venenatum]CEI59960.1 unnamed protein product [Fusarium venenatum]
MRLLWLAHVVLLEKKYISSFLAGAPNDKPLFDNDPNIYDIHKAQRSDHQEMNDFVHGRGEGFGNQTSIQTCDIVMAAKETGKVFNVMGMRPQYPVCHVVDTARFYMLLIKAIVTDQEPDCGRHGTYLVSAGHIIWDDLYTAMAKALSNRGIIQDDVVELAEDRSLANMANALGVIKTSVQVKISENSTFTPKHAKSIGWKAQFPPQHALDTADEEVYAIPENLQNARKGIH